MTLTIQRYKQIKLSNLFSAMLTSLAMNKSGNTSETIAIVKFSSQRTLHHLDEKIFSQK